MAWRTPFPGRESSRFLRGRGPCTHRAGGPVGGDGRRGPRSGCRPPSHAEVKSLDSFFKKKIKSKSLLIRFVLRCHHGPRDDPLFFSLTGFGEWAGRREGNRKGKRKAWMRERERERKSWDRCLPPVRLSVCRMARQPLHHTGRGLTPSPSSSPPGGSSS